MKIIADLHPHSKYSRGTSAALNLPELNLWSKYKGLDIVGTGDCLHPVWQAEIQSQLENLGGGFWRLREEPQSPVKFLLTAEVSSIYSKAGRVYKIHNILLFPDIASAQKLTYALSPYGKISSDGRPILGLDAEELVKIALNINPEILIIPAHIWTPHFSLFGANSGFDRLGDCFGKMSPYIFAVETGLSSDPAMNHRLSQLDRLAIISNSDAHSGANLAREATIFELPELSFQALSKAIKNNACFCHREAPLSGAVAISSNSTEIASPLDKLRARNDNNSCILGTIEFFPEEGKYHFNGHRVCGIVRDPREDKNKICPKCGRPLTIGVMHRVEDLADRPANYVAQNRPPAHYLVGLEKIIAETLGVAPASKKVREMYLDLINRLGPELEILLNLPEAEIVKVASPEIVEGIRRVRAKQVKISPGFDGVYGKVSVFGDSSPKVQQALF